eukprot:CAMPEP_0171065070 /NCGR_PEP_ID=MMETSP0766_2-20121228/6640_1 /TAXON_ID=439317 /ORGANISM="Gambierdiscus australes, Strain CAWD 149" /LENGTH=295 /DNA_ID=CAMNT_0011521143 /DNA_START=27 /DNA_END=915 /DNA_ORIENTATION=-
MPQPTNTSAQGAEGANGQAVDTGHTLHAAEAALAAAVEEAVGRCPFPSSFVLCQSHKQEDRLVIDCRGHNTFWAVFDGHRGHAVAGHAAKVSPGLLWSSPLMPSKPGEALMRMLHECHQTARREELRGGSTAVMAVAVGGLLWCCFAGDSRAVVGLRGGGARRLSVDHTTSLPEERERVTAGGGSLEWGRLAGVLPMTRGLGNFDLETAGFACLPEVSQVPISEVEFVVLASDGLWDVLSDEVVCALLREWGNMTVGCGHASEMLALEARARGSSDDIAVVVSYFPQELPYCGGA